MLTQPEYSYLRIYNVEMSTSLLEIVMDTKRRKSIQLQSNKSRNRIENQATPHQDSKQNNTVTLRR